MKSTTSLLSILICLWSFSPGRNGQMYSYSYVYVSESTKYIKSLNQTECLDSGVVSDGLVVVNGNQSELITPLASNGTCAKGSIGLNPGVVITDISCSSYTLVASPGACLTQGLVITGKVSSLGSTVQNGSALTWGKNCLINSDLTGVGLALSTQVVVEITPIINYTDYSGYVVPKQQQPPTVQDISVLENFNYTAIVVNETSCLDIGLVLNGVVEINATKLAYGHGWCQPGTVGMQPEVVVVDSNGTCSYSQLSVDYQCLHNGVIRAGRIVVPEFFHLVPIGGSITWSKICSASPSSGVLVQPGVTLLLVSSPAKLTTFASEPTYPVTPSNIDPYENPNDLIQSHYKRIKQDTDIFKKMFKKPKRMYRPKPVYFSHIGHDPIDSPFNDIFKLYVNEGIGRIDIDNMDADIDIDLDTDSD